MSDTRDRDKIENWVTAFVTLIAYYHLVAALVSNTI
jgi:hypothetical protein